MAIRPIPDHAAHDVRIATWLKERAPEPAPVDLVGRISASTQNRRPDPAWLARWHGQHLAGPPAGRARRSWWLPAVAMLVLGGSVMAVIASGGPLPDRQTVIVPPPVVVTPAVPSATHRETARPEPTQPPESLAVYRSVRDGYSLLLPKAWRDTVTVQDEGVTRFGSPRAGTEPALTISVGDRAGSVTLCQPACEPIVVRTFDELERALLSDPQGVPGSHDVAGMGWLGDTTAHVEKAAVSSGCLGCPARYHVYTIRAGRPIVLAFNFWNVTWNGLGPGADGGPFSEADLEVVLRSFVFPPATGGPSSTPTLPSDWPSEGWQLVPYENIEDGYSVQLPEAWRDSARPLNGDTSVTAFGHQPSGAGEAGLTISVGELDGSVDVCPTADRCHRIVVRNLEDLAATLRVTPNILAGGTLHSVGFLGPTGRPGTPVELVHSCLACSGARFHVFKIEQGRPIVFSFDDWTVRGFMAPTDRRRVVQVYDFEDVLESFVLWSGP